MPSNLPACFNATTQDVEMLLAAQCHLGSKNLQVHMEPYLWKTRPDGINVINIGKTWYAWYPEALQDLSPSYQDATLSELKLMLTCCAQGEDRPRRPHYRRC